MLRIKHFVYIKMQYKNSLTKIMSLLNVTVTLASKCFDYQLLVALYERGQGIPSGGDKEGEERVADVTIT